MQQSLHLWLTENCKAWHAEDKQVDEKGADIDSCEYVAHTVLVESLCQLGMSKIMTTPIFFGIKAFNDTLNCALKPQLSLRAWHNLH